MGQKIDRRQYIRLINGKVTLAFKMGKLYAS